MDIFTNAFGAVLVLVMVASFLALLNERLVEMFVSPLLERVRRKWLLPYVALATGVLMVVLFGVDIMTPPLVELGAEPVSPLVGLIVTGLIVGSGSMFVHDIWPAKLPLGKLKIHENSKRAA